MVGSRRELGGVTELNLAMGHASQHSCNGDTPWVGKDLLRAYVLLHSG